MKAIPFEIILKPQEHRYNEFCQLAINDKETYRFFGGSGYYSPVELEITTYNTVMIMLLERSDGCVHLSRLSGDEYSICIWAIPSSQRTIVVYSLIVALKTILTRLNPSSISAQCAETNLKIRPIISKLMGEPWGIEPDSYWDMELGMKVNRLWFKRIRKPDETWASIIS